MLSIKTHKYLFIELFFVSNLIKFGQKIALDTPEPDKWVDRYSDYLYNYAIGRVNNHEVAQDIVSETFLSALKGIKSFEGRSSERTWLIAIIKRKIIDYYRKQSTEKERAKVSFHNMDADYEKDWLEENVADLQLLSADEKLENDELRMAILECMTELNDIQARVFRMKNIEGLDSEYICNELNITPSNLWVILHRARKILMDCMEKKWFN